MFNNGNIKPIRQACKSFGVPQGTIHVELVEEYIKYSQKNWGTEHNTANTMSVTLL